MAIHPIITTHPHTIQIRGESIPFVVKKRRGNRISLMIKEGPVLQVSTFRNELSDFERGFIEENADWVLKYFQKYQQKAGKKEAFLSRIDREVVLLGKVTPVKYTVAGSTSFHYRESEGLMLSAPQRYIESHKKELLYFGLRAMAEKKLPKTLDKWAEICELPYKTLRIKDLKSRWGSCSTQRNINLNWQLLFLEQTLIDYVVIHELMHLHEMNHSKRFWNWVSKYYPDHKLARKKIKEQQWLIGILK